jgi:hypothetical protein
MDRLQKGGGGEIQGNFLQIFKNYLEIKIWKSF